MSRFNPRRGQREIMDYQGGLMGVSAVPGSGKTATIAALAARLIARDLPAGGQVLVVTYQNTAVENVRSRIREELEAMNLVQAGYEVRTLHSLSYGIIQTYPGLAGTTTDFQVLDERVSTGLLDKAVRLWNSRNTRVWAGLGPGDYYDDYWEQEWRGIAQKIGRTVISTAKNQRIRPEALQELIAAAGEDDVDRLLRIGVEIYQLYQQQVETIGGLDFDDLVWMAVELLEHHPDLKERLRRRWPFILEDEAQDSVPLQEELLGMLAGEEGNWIRVGDPNQSIMSTFTAADPGYLRRFLERENVRTLEMAISGRSAARIMDLANHLVEWICDRHPLYTVREQAFRRQAITPTEPDDPQQNPPAEASHVVFREYTNRLDEMRDLARRAVQFAEKNPDRTLSILVPTNRLGFDMAGHLRDLGAEFDEMLQSTRPERETTESLSRILAYLAEPLQARALEGSYTALRAAGMGGGEAENVALLLRSCYRPETLLFPDPNTRPEDALPPVGEVSPVDVEAILALTGTLRRWLRARALPIDQLVMTVAQDIFAEDDLARAQKLAVHLRGRADQNLEWRLPELARELDQIVRGRTPFALPGQAPFSPQPGRITLTTMHRAKGLEWDLVYLMGVDADWFPFTLEDRFRGEYEFLGGDPAAQARATLLALIGAGEVPRSATDAAHAEIIAERLRLLYVGITRSRQYLALSWSREIPAGIRTRPVAPAAVFRQLKNYHEANNRNG